VEVAEENCFRVWQPFEHATYGLNVVGHQKKIQITVAVGGTVAREPVIAVLPISGCKRMAPKSALS